MVGVVFVMPVNMLATDPIPEGMVSYWRFDDGIGDTAGDSADGNDGNLIPSGPPSWTTGKLGGALSLDGSNDHVVINDNTDLDFGTGDFTISLWVRLNLINHPDDFHMFYSNYDKPGYLGCIQISHRVSTDHLRIFFDDTTYNIDWNPVAETWYYITVLRNGNNLMAYIDGTQIGSTIDVSGKTISNSYDIHVGANAYAGLYYVNGIMDELAIWNEALTFNEIQQFYNDGNGMEITPDSSVIGLWHFNDGSGETAMDSSTNNNHGSLEPSGPSWTTGLVGGALEFDGTDNYISIPDSDSLDIIDEITVEFWVYHNDASLIGIEKNYLTKHSTSTLSGFALTRYFIDNKVYFQMGNGAQWAAVNVYTASNVVSQPNKWYHIAGTYDGYEANIYVDGVLEGTHTISTTIQPNDANILIGDNVDTPGYFNGYINGLMDEVAVWNRALTDDEILLHYTNGLIGEDYCYIPPDQAIQNLFDDIQNIEDLPEGSEINLLSKLDSALECLDNGNDNSAINILNAFINAVAAQSGKKLSVEQADELIAAAQEILDAIGTL
jgi:hypothetical protein